MQNAPDAQVGARRLRLVRDRRPARGSGQADFEQGRPRVRAHPARALPPGASTRAAAPRSSQTGPFYCPADRRSTSTSASSATLANRFNAPGDFAQAYVLAHEYGHHIQTITGITQQVDTATRENPDQRNALSVRVELQADCLAGVWAHSTYERGLLERGRPRGGPDRRRVGRRRPHPGRRRRVRSAPRRSRTAPRSSAPAGSSAASRTATRPPATPSPATSEPQP